MIIDRDRRRNKLDKNFRDEFETFREKMDIADFNLEAYLTHLRTEKKLSNTNEIYCIAKHLCGGATDLSLNSVLQKQYSSPVKGIAIATCCHHQCDLRTYSNLPLLLNEAAFTLDEIAVLPRISSWTINPNLSEGDMLSKKSIGLMVKRIFDYGRLRFI